MSFMNKFLNKHRHELEVRRGGDGYRSTGYTIPEHYFHKFLHLE